MEVAQESLNEVNEDAELLKPTETYYNRCRNMGLRI